MSTENPSFQPAPTNDGGAAFPYNFDIVAGSFDPFKGRTVPPNTTERYVGLGMNLRDYFAGQAITGCLPGDLAGPPEERARWAYRMADAMLKVRGGAA